MGQTRVELVTPALSERCSNQLSYCPKLSGEQGVRTPDPRLAKPMLQPAELIPLAYYSFCLLTEQGKKELEQVIPITN